MPECALAARSAAETNGSGPQDAIPAAAGSGAKLGISGLDPDAGMRSLPRVNCGATVIEAAHHQRSGCQRDESKRPRISRLSRCVQPITGRIWILIIVWERTDSRTNMGLTSKIRASNCTVDSGSKTFRIPPCSSGAGLHDSCAPFGLWETGDVGIDTSGIRSDGRMEMPTAKESLRKQVDQLSEEQAQEILGLISTGGLRPATSTTRPRPRSPAKSSESD